MPRSYNARRMAALRKLAKKHRTEFELMKKKSYARAGIARKLYPNEPRTDGLSYREYTTVRQRTLSMIYTQLRNMYPKEFRKLFRAESE